MARLAGRRALFAVPVLLVVTFGVFAIAAASPFDPVKAYAGTAALGADQQTLDRLRGCARTSVWTSPSPPAGGTG